MAPSPINPGLEFHHQVDVAVPPEVVTQGRAEYGEPSDVVTPAERRDRTAIDIEVKGHGAVRYIAIRNGT
jgi:hypothetical protein